MKQIPIEALEQLGDQPVARVFEGGVVTWPGAVLVVPLHGIGGDLNRLQDRCPCPIADVIDVLDKPRAIPFDEAESGLWPGPGARFTALCQILDAADIRGSWWVCASQSLSARIFMHDCGLRLGLTTDMIDRRPS